MTTNPSRTFHFRPGQLATVIALPGFVAQNQLREAEKREQVQQGEAEKRERERQKTAELEDSKTCPMCAESVKKAAKNMPVLWS